MKLLVISSKTCWKSDNSTQGYVTDGGFPIQMQAISELFSETQIAVPCEKMHKSNGVTTIKGNQLQIVPLTVPKGQGMRRKLSMLNWLFKNGFIIWQKVKQADAIHAPIPGDIGTLGILFALLQRKPLFVRHCGNWLIQRTTAERFWKWIMERYAGGRNVMLATGGSSSAPSEKNSNVKWIFSTSLRKKEMEKAVVSEPPADGNIKLITACRLEDRKGVDVVIESFPLVLEKFPNAILDVVGDGSLITKLKEQAKSLEIQDKVIFHGKVKQSNVINLMKKAHVFCFPTSASEGFPKVVVEALACGLPVVTTRVSVLPHLIGNHCGILLDKPESSELARAIISICSNPEKYKQMSQQSINTAQQYTLENWRDFIGENLQQSWNVSSLSSEQ